MLGKYRVLEPLGRGGMAQVYRAYHPQLDRYAAIKVLRSDLVEQDEFLARFRREARSVAALRHPNIVQVFDFDIQDEVYFMVMELLEGDTLKAHLNAYRSQGQTMPYAEVVRIMLDILSGLSYAHSEGVIHRDIKPANIMLSRKGQAVVTDFGIAQIVGGTQYTVSGALMGTLNYMAPEQGLKGECDARSDLYSLGIVFYEILTGRPPFDADTPLAILMKHLNDPLPLPRTLNGDIPEAFERIALKVLAKQPEDRYQSAAEMAQALQAAAAEINLDPATGSLPGFALPFTSASPTHPGVFSGPARKQAAAAQFSADDTDANIQAATRRLTEKTLTLDEQAEKAAADIEAAAKAAAGTLVRNLSTSLVYTFNLISRDDDPAPETAAGETAVTPVKKRQDIVSAAFSLVLALSLGSLAIFGIAGLTGQWDIITFGWPIWLFLLAYGLTQLMGALSLVFMLIPVGLVLGNGYIMGFFSLTGAWNAWLFLWPLEPVLVFVVIYFTLRLADRPNRAASALPELVARLSQFALLSTAGLWVLSLITGFIR